MFVRAVCSLVLALIAGMTLNLSPCHAEIFTPGTTVPMLSDEVFTWNEGDAHSTYAFWDNFGTVGGMATPALGPGISPDPDSIFTDGNADTLLTFNSFATVIGSGNAYGFNFGDPAPFQPQFIIDAFATVRSGTSGGDNTRIVAQWQTQGSELDYDSIFLSLSATDEGTIAPDLSIETGRGPAGGFGGDIVNRLAIWDLDSSQAEYRIDFNAQANHLSFDQFRVDTFTQSAPFITPTSIPEPSSFALLGAISGIVCLRRRRR